MWRGAMCGVDGVQRKRDELEEHYHIVDVAGIVVVVFVLVLVLSRGILPFAFAGVFT